VTVPITIRCECGHALSTPWGERAECERCGRAYDTEQIPRSDVALVEAVQRRFRHYAWFGLLFVIAVTVLAFAAGGLVWAGFAFPTAGLVWYRFIRPFWRRRYLAAVRALPSWDLRAVE
jgi:hypothetical protein